MIDYDDSTHTYRRNGVVVPSVTQILSPPNAFYKKGSAERGTRAHEVCAEIAADPFFNWDDPYAESFCLWCDDRRVEFLKIETIIDGDVDGHHYAGRFDFLALIDGKKVLVDIKTGVKAKWHKAQVAAYALAENCAQCRVVYLTTDKTYKEDVLTTAELVAGISTFKEAFRRYREAS
jgi:hypothetical protein